MTSCTLDDISIPVSTAGVPTTLTSERTFGLHYSRPSKPRVSISLLLFCDCDRAAAELAEGGGPYLVGAHDSDTVFKQSVQILK